MNTTLLAIQICATALSACNLVLMISILRNHKKRIKAKP